MSKPLFQDIIPPDRRSIKQIPVRPSEREQHIPVYEAEEDARPSHVIRPRSNPSPSRPAPVRPEPVRSYEREQHIPIHRDTVPVPPPRRSQPEREIRPEPRYQDSMERELEHEERVRALRSHKEKKSGARFLIPFIILAAIAGVAYWGMSRVTGATVAIIPKQEAVAVDSQFTAQKEGNAGLQFQLVSHTKDGKLAVPSTGQEMATTRASGVIVIFNSTSADQTLVGNTRFETEGKIFRISQSITVPGSRMVDGKSVPGSIEAVITADAIGPEYNVGIKDFTIPGFKGDPKYTQITARSKPQNPVQGGFNGLRNKVEPAELAQAREKVRTGLKESLLKELTTYIPSGYIMPTNGYVIVYESLPDIQENGGVKINERATFNGFIFMREDLGSEIAKRLKGTTTDPVEIGSIDNLVFSVISPATDAWKSNTIQFNLKGTTNLISIVDTEKLRQDLVGKPRNSLNAILAGYPVAEAEVTMRPFWKKSFPELTEEIAVNVGIPTQE
jgi:hypothetical protein